MPEFVRIASRAELPAAGQAKEFKCGEKVVCVANVDGEISAMDNVCMHRGGPLGQGLIEGDKLICPWHGWQWDPKTGAVVHNPNFKLAVYPVRIDGDDVKIEM